MAADHFYCQLWLLARSHGFLLLLCHVFLAEQLSQKDAIITQALSEKLQLFADLAESVIGPEDAASRSRLLLRGDAPDLQQGEALLKGAITEGRLTPPCVCLAELI